MLAAALFITPLDSRCFRFCGDCSCDAGGLGGGPLLVADDVVDDDDDDNATVEELADAGRCRCAAASGLAWLSRCSAVRGRDRDAWQRTSCSAKLAAGIRRRQPGQTMVLEEASSRSAMPLSSAFCKLKAEES